MYCYANVGAPKNPQNPFYQQTDTVSNPIGYNPQGADFIDYGLGMNPNPAPDGTVFYNVTPGDIQQFRGLFKAPSLRNVDKRTAGGFVKAYFHNGVFKSLKEVVHFYNMRNIAVNSQGKQVAFDLRVGPPAGYTPLFAPPEVLDTTEHRGLSPADAGNDVSTNGQVGNLGLTPSEEDDIVNFLKTLMDVLRAPTRSSLRGCEPLPSALEWGSACNTIFGSERRTMKNTEQSVSSPLDTAGGMTRRDCMAWLARGAAAVVCAEAIAPAAADGTLNLMALRNNSAVLLTTPDVIVTRTRDGLACLGTFCTHRRHKLDVGADGWHHTCSQYAASSAWMATPSAARPRSPCRNSELW